MKKKKYGPLLIKKTLTQIIKKIIQTNISSVLISIDNLVSSGPNEVTLEMIITSIENSKYVYRYKDEKDQLKIKKHNINVKKENFYK